MAVNDSQDYNVGSPTNVAVLDNDTDNEALDPSSVQLIDPATGSPTNSVSVAGEGTWAVQADGSITFTPNAGFRGTPSTINYTVDDTSGNTSNQGTIALTDNTPPVATSDTRNYNVGAPTNITVLTNDSDNEALDPSSVRLIDPTSGTPTSSVSIAGEGTWTVQADGSISFTPNAGFTGTPSTINYTVDDTSGNTSGQATITLTDATPPVATNDTQSYNVGSPTSITVLTNDSDNEGIDSASVRLIDPTTNAPSTSVAVSGEGTWVVQPDGSITFTPEVGFTGTPSPINYTVDDTSGNTSGQATITLTDSTPPVATSDSLDYNVGSPTNIVVVANDTDNEAIDATSVQLIDPSTGNPSTSVNITGEGNWAVQADGSITFTPTAGFTGNPSTINYTVDDTSGNTSNQATITLTDNTPPVATNDSQNYNVGSATNVVVLTNDLDNEAIDSGSVQLIDPSNSTPSTSVNVPGEGNWTVQPDGSVTFTPNAGFTGTPSTIAYVVDDTSGNTSNQGTITLTDAEPPVANDDSLTYNVSAPTNIVVLTNDSDNEAIDPSSVQLIDPLTANPASSVSVTGEGTWSVQANGSITFTPDVGFTGTPSTIDYTVDDTSGNTSNQATITLTDTAPPVATNDSLDYNVGSPTTITVLSNDTDNEALDPSSVQIIDPNTGSSVTSLNVSGEGTWSVQPDGSITFTPDAGFTGTPSTINYTVDDTSGNTSNQGTITLTDNTPPNAGPDTNPYNVGSPTNIVVLTNDTDNEAIDPTTVQLIDPSTGTSATSVAISGEGVWSVQSDGSITFTPISGFTGTPTSISYTVDDTSGNTSPPAVITLTDNTPPSPIDDTQPYNVSAPTTISVLANDSDNEALDPSTVRLVDPATGSFLTAVNVPGEGTWSVLPDGSVTFTPSGGFTGTPSPISYTVADTTGNQSPPATITLVDNTPPNSVDDSLNYNVGAPTNIVVLTNDSDNEAIDPGSVRLVDPSTGSNVSSVVVVGQGTWTVQPDGSVTFAAESGFTGTPDTVDYTVGDTSGNRSTPATITLTDGTPPVATEDTVPFLFGGPTNVPVLANDTDNEGIDPTSVQLVDPTTGVGTTTVNVPGEGTWSVQSDGSVTFTPATGFADTPTPISYTVADTSGNRSNPTAIHIQIPEIAVSNSVTNVAINGLQANLTIQLTVQNTGSTHLNNLSLTDNLASQFGDNFVAIQSVEIVNSTATSDPNLNSGYIDDPSQDIFDGSSGRLQPGEQVVVQIVVSTAPTSGQTTVTLENQAAGAGTPVDNLGNPILDASNNPLAPVTDLSDSGSNPSTTNPGAPGDSGSSDDPTETTITFFTFDSFTNQSEPDAGRAAFGPIPLGTPNRALSQEIAMLAPEPMFSGSARPGTKIVGRIYDENGFQIGHEEAFADVGGNWMMQVHNLSGGSNRYARVVFEEVRGMSASFSPNADAFGYMGSESGNNDYASLEPWTPFEEQYDFAAIYRGSAKVTLASMHRQHNSSLGLGTDI